MQTAHHCIYLLNIWCSLCWRKCSWLVYFQYLLFNSLRLFEVTHLCLYSIAFIYFLYLLTFAIKILLISIFYSFFFFLYFCNNSFCSIYFSLYFFQLNISLFTYISCLTVSTLIIFQSSDLHFYLTASIIFLFSSVIFGNVRFQFSFCIFF